MSLVIISVYKFLIVFVHEIPDMFNMKTFLSSLFLEVRASSQDVPATEVVEVSQPRGESKRRERRVKTNHV